MRLLMDIWSRSICIRFLLSFFMTNIKKLFPSLNWKRRCNFTYIVTSCRPVVQMHAFKYVCDCSKRLFECMLMTERFAERAQRALLLERSQTIIQSRLKNMRARFSFCEWTFFCAFERISHVLIPTLYQTLKFDRKNKKERRHVSNGDTSPTSTWMLNMDLEWKILDMNIEYRFKSFNFGYGFWIWI